MATVPHSLTSQPFRRHLIGLLPGLIVLSFLYGLFLALAYRAFQSQFTPVAIGLALAAGGCLLSGAIRVVTHIQFALFITPRHIIIEEMGNRRILDRIHISNYDLRRDLLGLTNSGTLELSIGGQVVTFAHLTPFRDLCAALEGP